MTARLSKLECLASFLQFRLASACAFYQTADFFFISFVGLAATGKLSPVGDLNNAGNEVLHQGGDFIRSKPTSISSHLSVRLGKRMEFALADFLRKPILN